MNYRKKEENKMSDKLYDHVSIPSLLFRSRQEFIIQKSLCKTFMNTAKEFQK